MRKDCLDHFVLMARMMLLHFFDSRETTLPQSWNALCGKMFAVGLISILSIFLCLEGKAQESNSETEQPVPQELRIGYSSSMDPNVYIDLVTPLIDALQQKFPTTLVRTQELASGEMTSQEISKMDFLLLSGAEARIFDETTFFPVATWQSAGSKEINQSIGSVFVVKADSPIQQLVDMKGKSVAATDSQSFEGWLIAMNAIAKAGFQWENFFSTKTFTHWQYPDVLTLVEVGMTDVGILPTCTLERAIAQGALLPNILRVVNDQTELGKDKCQRSTELFPGMQLVALPHVSPDVVKNVMLSLFSMPNQEGGAKWLPNNDTSRVMQLMENLHIGPYAYLKEFSLRALWKRYQSWVMLALAVVVFLVLDILRVNHIVKRRTEELEEESQARQRASAALEVSQNRLALLERASMVSQLSTMIAHDIKQPLTIVVNYVNGLKLLLDQGKVDVPLFSRTMGQVVKEAYRASDIIERVREVNRRDWATRSWLDLVALVGRVLEYAKLPLEKISLPDEAWVVGNALEIELVVLNLLRNAKVAANSPGGGGNVQLRLEKDEREIRLAVIDDGPPITDAVFSQLGKVTRSSKPDGMGYGLAIASSIMEAHRGHIVFDRQNPQGLIAQSVFPLIEEQTSQKLRDSSQNASEGAR